VAAHAASTRTREIGVRMALGADGWDIVRLFLREVLWLAGLSVVAGLMLSALASQWLASFLFGLAPTDAVTYVGSAVMLVIVTAIATAIPAHRAARADPLQALRSE
jgi:ABC-type antimicrobial peptide transport system permease subunit